MSNSGTNCREKIQILGRAELILTSTYHGENWSVLLGKRVIAFPSRRSSTVSGAKSPCAYRLIGRGTRPAIHAAITTSMTAVANRRARRKPGVGAAAGAGPRSLMRGSPPQSRMRCSVLRSPNWSTTMSMLAFWNWYWNWTMLPVYELWSVMTLPWTRYVPESII